MAPLGEADKGAQRKGVQGKGVPLKSAPLKSVPLKSVQFKGLTLTAETPRDPVRVSNFTFCPTVSICMPGILISL